MDHPLQRIGILIAFGLLVAFYLAVGGMILHPRVDDDYRRTYLTREFGAYPPSAFFKGRNGLDYVPGETADLTDPKRRLLLNRFDWIWRGPPGPRLDGTKGRIFVHVVDEARRPDMPHRLSLTLVCRFPEGVVGRFGVTVNGKPATAFTCPAGDQPFTVSAELPAGSIGAERYDAIVVTRELEGFSDRVATAVGALLSSFSLVSFKVETLPKP